MNRDTLLAILPPEKGVEEMITPHQDVEDIVQEIQDAHDKFAPDYDLICSRFAGGHVEKKLFEYCKNNLAYHVEDGKEQTTKSPTVLLKQGHCDCKGYAGFIAGVLDALNRCGKGRFNWCYRFADYGDPDTWHVFIVVKQKGSEEWIDPVMSEFDQRDPAPITYEDKHKPMLVRMSGTTPAPALRPAILPRGPAFMAGPLSGYRVGTAPAAGFTAAQLGIPIAQAVFQHWNEYPGAVQELAVNPPFRFFVGSQQIPLPPPVTVPGTAVPEIPPGLHVVWDPFFMGRPIPADMLNVAVIGPALVVSPLEIYSAGGSGAATIDFLWNKNRWLLFLFLGVLENLIASYSSYPWGNQFNDLAQQLNSSRNYGNWLVYPNINSKTFFGNVISQASQIYLKVQSVVQPIETGLINAVIPGSGAILNAAGNLENSLIAKATGNQAPVPIQPVQSVTPVNQTGVPGSLSFPDVAGQVMQFAQANPVVAIGIGAGVVLLLYEIFKD